MAKMELLEDDGKTAYTFYCPGCKHHHMFFVQGYKISWGFNGSLDNPTFTPSLRNRYGDGKCCHLFVENGMIKYCDDCYHELSGKTIEMEDVNS
jgi:hypothetical protein